MYTYGQAGITEELAAQKTKADWEQLAQRHPQAKWRTEQADLLSQLRSALLKLRQIEQLPHLLEAVPSPLT